MTNETRDTEQYATESALQPVVTGLADAFEVSSRDNHAELRHLGDWDTCPRVGCSTDRAAIEKVDLPAARKAWATNRTTIERLTSENEQLRAALVAIEHNVDHWLDCPLPPDAECVPCHLFARGRRLSKSLLESHNAAVQS